jgi:hypothetical protein
MWSVFAESGRRKLEEKKRDEDELGGHLKLLLIYVVLMEFDMHCTWVLNIYCREQTARFLFITNLCCSISVIN